MDIEISNDLLRVNGVSYSIRSIIKIYTNAPKLETNKSRIIVLTFGIITILSAFGNKDKSVADNIMVFIFGIFLIHFCKYMDKQKIISLGRVTITTASGEHNIYESDNLSELKKVMNKIERAIEKSL